MALCGFTDLKSLKFSSLGEVAIENLAEEGQLSQLPYAAIQVRSPKSDEPRHFSAEECEDCQDWHEMSFEAWKGHPVCPQRLGSHWTCRGLYLYYITFCNEKGVGIIAI